MEVYGIIILWLTFSLLVFCQYVPATKNISATDKILFVFICVIGGPIFSMASILETMLNCILPDGWNDDNE
jgi:hypothetical protein